MIDALFAVSVLTKKAAKAVQESQRRRGRDPDCRYCPVMSRKRACFLNELGLRLLYQDPPCTLNWGYIVPNSRYLGPNRE